MNTTDLKERLKKILVSELDLIDIEPSDIADDETITVDGQPASVAELAKALRGTGYPYASHMRNEDDRVLAAVVVVDALGVARVRLPQGAAVDDEAAAGRRQANRSM